MTERLPAALVAVTFVVPARAAEPSASIQSLVRDAVRQARQLTGLEPPQPVRYQRVALERLKESVASAMERLLEPSSAPEAGLLAGLGLLPAGYPLHRALREDLSYVPPAWYDDRKHLLFVVPVLVRSDAGSAWLVREAVRALAHETGRTRALGGWRDADVAAWAAVSAAAALCCRVAGGGDPDRCRWHAYEKPPALLGALQQLERAALERLGARFRHEGTAALRSWLEHLPASTAELLHGQRRMPRRPLPLARGERALGELGVRAWLAPVLGPAEAARVAAGWAGDRAFLARSEAQGGRAVWITRWRDERAARSFAAAAQQRLQAADLPAAAWHIARHARDVDIAIDRTSVPVEELGDEPWGGVRLSPPRDVPREGRR